MKKKDDLEQYKDISVANMNVEGMPWYTKNPVTTTQDKEVGMQQTEEKEPLSAGETTKLMATALVAALFIGLLLLAGFFLLLLFCVTVWL